VSSLLPWPDEALLPRRWEGIARILRRCLALAAEGALPHTLLLEGDTGLGREALAVELAAGLVCPAGGRPDCACHACDRVRRGMHPDVEIVRVEEGAHDIRMEQAQEVVQRLPQLPYEGRHRVIVIDSAHTPPLNVHAASALLKALEEPPAHVTFLLLAANPARVLPTVLSRSVVLRVPPPGEEELASLVQALHGLDEATARELVTELAGEARLLVHPDGPALPDLLGSFGTRLRAALEGDSLGLVLSAALVRQHREGHLVAARALLGALRGVGAEGQEAALDAAARLLAAAARSDALKLDAEATACAALAPLAVRGGW